MVKDDTENLYFIPGHQFNEAGLMDHKSSSKWENKWFFSLNKIQTAFLPFFIGLFFKY